MGWDKRSPFERMMDDIAAADSPAEVEHLRGEVRSDFGDRAQRARLEAMCDAKRRALLAADRNDA